MKKFLLIVLALIVIVIAGLFIFVSTVDANKYRGQIAEALSKQTGRSVELKGPLTLGLSLHGIVLGIQDASIGNPPWASRKEMANVGHFELGLALMPLLSHQVSITQLKIENADIQLETSADGKHNWEFTPAGQEPASGTPAKPTTSPGGKVAISVDSLSVKDSQLAIRDKDGKTSILKVSDITASLGSSGATVKGSLDYNGAPISIDIKAETSDLFGKGAWPVDAALDYADYKLKAKGKASVNAKTLDLDSYEVDAGQTTLHGKLAVNAGGAKPSVKGTIESDKLNMADLKPSSSSGTSAPAEKPSDKPASGKMFSDAPLGFDALKSADADLTVTIGELILGKADLKQVSAKLELSNGRLTLSPLKATLNNATLSGDVKVDGAASPATVAINFNAPGVDLGDLLRMGDMPVFVTGKADSVLGVTSSGESMHALASHANGKLSVIAANGDVSSSAANDISGGLAQLLTAGKGSIGLNCLAARFNIANGVATDNGILADTTASTLAGKGGFNLGEETINLLLRAKPKLVNVGGIVPPLKVGGTFTKPGFSTDTSAVAQNVMGIISSGSFKNALSGDSGVPAIQTHAGDNACVYTLDHPAAAPAATTTQQPNSPGNIINNLTGSGKTGDKVKNIGGALKGLLGQ